MVDNFKNRQVVQSVYQPTISLLSFSDMNSYKQNGFISPVQPYYEHQKMVTEKVTDKKWNKRFNLDKLLGIEYYKCSIASDGVPVAYYLHWSYGLITLIRFSDNTILLSCKNLENLFFELKNKFESVLFNEYVYVNLNSKKKGEKNG